MTDHPLEELPPTLLFQFAAPCRWIDSQVVRSEGLSEAYRIPLFGTLDGGAAFADLRVAWNEQELAFQVEVHGPPDSFAPGKGTDTVQLYLDTRATHNVHRATRFCRLFVFQPFGPDNRFGRPTGNAPPIYLARDVPAALPAGAIGAKVDKLEHGYRMVGGIRADALPGYDPIEHPRLGFNGMVSSPRLGEQWFAVSHKQPYHHDPSLWGDLELVRG
jgi:hypothetical protein